MITLPELLDRTRIVALPLHTRFRGVDVREAALIEGTQAWGEFSPFLEYGAREAGNWLAAAIEYGFDETLPRPAAGTVAVNGTVPAIPAADVATLLARFSGVGTVKVKVAEAGQTLDDDVARVGAVREALPDARIRIDANGGWTLDEAARALRAIAASGIALEYAEQPCASVAELAELRARIRSVSIAADESVRKASDPLAVARAGAADRIVVKVQPLGGIRRAQRIVAKAGLPATVSSALDTSVGIVMGAQLAHSLPQPQAAAGLGTMSLFAADITRKPRVPVRGEISLAPVVPDEALLREHAAPGPRADWWRERIREAWAYRPE